MKLTIHCPHHGDTETIEVPVAYADSGFKGDARCNPNDSEDSSWPIKIEIVKGQLVSVERG